MDTTMVLVIVLALVAAGVVIWLLQKQRSLRLRERFGPEYERTRAEVGDVRRTEAVLAAREKRVEKLHIRPLTPEEAHRFVDRLYALPLQTFLLPQKGLRRAVELAKRFRLTSYDASFVALFFGDGSEEAKTVGRIVEVAASPRGRGVEPLGVNIRRQDEDDLHSCANQDGGGSGLGRLTKTGEQR